MKELNNNDFRFWAGTNIMRPGEVCPCTREVFDRITDHPELRQLAKTILNTERKQERDALKHEAPYFLFHAADVAGGYRANKNITDSGLRFLDIDDDRMNFKEFYQQRVQPRIDQLGILMVHRSLGNPRHRGHIVFEAPRDEFLGECMTIEESQRWMADKLGCSYDESCCDLQRPSFAVPRKFILFMNEDKLFNTLN